MFSIRFQTVIQNCNSTWKFLRHFHTFVFLPSNCCPSSIVDRWNISYVNVTFCSVATILADFYDRAKQRSSSGTKTGSNFSWNVRVWRKKSLCIKKTDWPTMPGVSEMSKRFRRAERYVLSVRFCRKVWANICRLISRCIGPTT